MGCNQQKYWKVEWNDIKSYKVNTTSEIQYMNIWHSTFCQFLNIMKRFYWLSQQMQARFVVFKLLHFSNLVRVLPESDILISVVVFTLSGEADMISTCLDECCNRQDAIEFFWTLTEEELGFGVKSKYT